MLNMFRTAIAALGVAAAGLSATAPTASAASIELRIGTPGASVTLTDHRRHDLRRDHRRHDFRRDYRRHESRRDHRDFRRDRWAGTCRPAHAVHKARSMGIRRAGIIDISHCNVVVRGVKRGHPVYVTFANRYACPVIVYSR